MRWTQRSPTQLSQATVNAMIHSFDGNLRSQRALQDLATVFDLTGFHFEIARGALRSSEVGLSFDATSDAAPKAFRWSARSTMHASIRTTCCAASRSRWKPTVFHLHFDCWTTTASHGSLMNQIAELPVEAAQALKRLRPQWRVDDVSSVELLVGGYTNDNFALTYRDADYVLRS